MKRRSLKLGLLILAFLAAGAIINVAVAWALCMRAAHSVTKEYPPSDLIRSQFGALELPADGEMGFVAMSAGVVQVRCAASPIGGPQVAVEVIEAGWPAPSCAGKEVARGWDVKHSQSIPINLGHARQLPYGPLWPGFAINTIFYAAIAWLLLAFPGAVRRHRRIKRGLCPECAYPVGTNPRCTECGKPVKLRHIVQ